MTKIMLVEDDKSLREIYGVRLLAEGYDIVSAGDGEEALAMAIKERPTLILSDVMMPKISGFDMLDILRSTSETKNIKVIMMTALSSEEQRQRGEQLGADRYLVKSQVGIEDVVRVVHETLEDAPVVSPAPAVAPTPAPLPTPELSRTNIPVISPPQPAQSQAPAPLPPAPAQQHSSTTPQPPSNRNRVIQPLNDPNIASVNINELLDKELAKEAGVDLDARPTVATTEQEKAIVDTQLDQFSQNLNNQSATPLESIPVVNVSSEGTFTQVSPVAPATPQPQSAPSSLPSPSQPPQSSMPTPISVPPRPVPPAIPPSPTLPPEPQTETPATLPPSSAPNVVSQPTPPAQPAQTPMPQPQLQQSEQNPTPPVQSP